MKEILQQANEFVTQKELKYARDLFTQLKENERHAVVCGCPSCRKSVEGTRDAISKEAWRVFDPEPIDHEEEFIRRHGSH